jgi:hypothetical protein
VRLKVVGRRRSLRLVLEWGEGGLMVERKTVVACALFQLLIPRRRKRSRRGLGSMVLSQQQVQQILLQLLLLSMQRL